MPKKKTTQVKYSDLNEEQRNAYLSIKREEAFREMVDNADFSITTVETKKYEVNSGRFKGNSEVGKDAKDAKNKLIATLIREYAKDYPVEDFAPSKDSALINLDKINEYLEIK